MSEEFTGPTSILMLKSAHIGLIELLRGCKQLTATFPPKLSAFLGCTEDVASELRN